MKFTIRKGKLALSLKPAKTFINVGEEININAAPADSLSPFQYKSSNEAVAAINNESCTEIGGKSCFGCG